MCVAGTLLSRVYYRLPGSSGRGSALVQLLAFSSFQRVSALQRAVRLPRSHTTEKRHLVRRKRNQILAGERYGISALLTLFLSAHLNAGVPTSFYSTQLTNFPQGILPVPASTSSRVYLFISPFNSIR